MNLKKRFFKTQDQAKKAIFEYIETWYNIKLLHSSLGYMSPIEYEKQFGDVPLESVLENKERSKSLIRFISQLEREAINEKMLAQERKSSDTQ